MTSEFVANVSHQSDHSSPLRFILSHIRRHPWIAFLLVSGAFGNAMLGTAIPRFVGQAFNAIVNGPDIDLVTILAVSIAGSQFVRAIVQYLRNLASELYGQRIERDVRDELYASLLGKSMDFHDMQPVGEIMARVTNDVRELNLMMNPGINLIIGSGMFLLAPMLTAPSIHPQLILMPGIFVTLHVIVQYRFIRRMHPIAEEVRASFGRMNARLAESLEGLQVVKGAAQEDQEIDLFSDLADEVRDRFIEQGGVEARYLSILLLGLVIVMGFLHATILFRQGEIEVGDIVAFVGLLNLFGFPVFTSLFSLSRIALGYAGAARILEIIVAETHLDRNETGHVAPIRGDITLEQVHFSYVADKPVLHDMSFAIRAGQTVAIVGQTGAGKSSVTKLINRIYDVDSGHLLIDHIDVKDWNLESLRSQISIIEQDIFLFSRSIAENIAFGNPDATQDEIEDAARRAQAHDFILTFPDGYETVIGQRGVTLSGGQRQRLAIARAFVTNPPILILDDSTSAIDSATEDEIQKAIWAASTGRTTILITHRLSQIRWADHIIVLRQGLVVAQGSHEALLKTSEAYQRIFARYESATTPVQAAVVPDSIES